MKLVQYIKKIGPERFAAETGLSIHTAQSYACGRREPRPTTARKIEAATGGKVKIKDCYESQGA